MARNKKRKNAWHPPTPSPPSTTIVVEAPPPVVDIPKPQNDLVLTVAEVCELLKISRSTLLRADIPGKLKIGGCVRYHRETLDQWLLASVPTLKGPL